jgi:hypothetical protein
MPDAEMPMPCYDEMRDCTVPLSVGVEDPLLHPLSQAPVLSVCKAKTFIFALCINISQNSTHYMKTRRKLSNCHNR